MFTIDWSKLPHDAPHILFLERSEEKLVKKLAAQERSLERKLIPGERMSKNARRVKNDIQETKRRLEAVRDGKSRTERNMKLFRPAEYLAYRIYKTRFLLLNAERFLANKLQANGGVEGRRALQVREEIEDLRKDLAALEKEREIAR